MQDLARQHLTLLDQLGVERCPIIGLSVGSMWGAELALLAPDRVTALVLMDTSLDAEPDQARKRYFAMLDAVGALGSVPGPVVDAVAPLFFLPTIRMWHSGMMTTFESRLRNWTPERLKDSVAPLERIIFGRRSLLAELAGLLMPCLVMTGADDLAQPPERRQAMADRIGCRFVPIPDAGQIASLEAPVFVNCVLAQFLAAQQQ
jgi:pimeloyl-ACP methyl ester carboxylesterase